MSDKPKVAAIHISPEHFKEMQSLQTAEVIQDLGIAGDRYAQKRGVNRAKRQVLLMDQETLEELGLTPGTVRENITTRGMALYQLQPGARLSIGSDVVLEVTEPCEPCQRMEDIRPGLREQLKGRRGMLSRVVEGGTVSVGDTIKVLAAAPR
ncbi:MAG: MOSC domain-containing protein [Dehalococcoidia bacterium]